MAKTVSASRYWTVAMFEFPGVGEDGMSGRNVQRKLGTTRGSPRRSRTAKASRISRRAVKSRCACEWDGWGRLSDDGPGQNNPDPSEGPWGRWSIPPHGGAVIASTDRTLGGSTLKHEGRRQTDRRSADAGSRLKLIDAWGRSRLIRQPFSRNGENSPYGMLGGIVETSASFEARSAPRSYPTTATGETRFGHYGQVGSDQRLPQKHQTVAATPAVLLVSWAVGRVRLDDFKSRRA